MLLGQFRQGRLGVTTKGDKITETEYSGVVGCAGRLSFAAPIPQASQGPLGPFFAQTVLGDPTHPGSDEGQGIFVNIRCPCEKVLYSMGKRLGTDVS